MPIQTVYVLVCPGQDVHRNEAFLEIANAAKSNLEQIKQTIAQFRSESRQFFKLTLIFASLGFLIVILGVVSLLIGHVTAGVVSMIASLIPELTAALFFRKDKELRTAIKRYHQHALDMQTLLTMVSVAETTSNDSERNELKKKIIYKALDIKDRAKQ